MVYKKFVKRDGKTFGPYYYESYPDASDELCKRYLGTEDPRKVGKLTVPTAKSALFLGALVVFCFV